MIKVYLTDGSLYVTLDCAEFEHTVSSTSVNPAKCRVSPGNTCEHGYSVSTVTDINFNALLALLPKQEGPDWVADTFMAALKRGSSKGAVS